MAQSDLHDEITPQQREAAKRLFGNDNNIAKSADAALAYITARHNGSRANRHEAAGAVRDARQVLTGLPGRKYLRDRLRSIAAYTARANSR